MLTYSYDPSGNLIMAQTLENISPPQICGQPVMQVVEPGEIATFSVVVTDAVEMTFQWRLNGIDLPGATGDSLLLTNISADNEGQYAVVVTNSVGSVTSASAALMLNDDRDGLPDSWEKANFTDPDPTHPLNPVNQRSETDSDNDSVSNLDEFLDGTDPADKGSLRPTLTAYSGAGGSVLVTPMKLSYAAGESVTLTPLPFAPSVFVDWTGDLSGTDSPATLIMDRNKAVRARFASAVPLPPGLIALWRGETDASDLIGGHHGTFFAGAAPTGPSVTASGKVGGAFNFDGTVYVRVPDSAALRPARLTVEAWVFPTAIRSQTIVARGSSKDDFDTWYLGLDNVNRPEFIFKDNHLLQGSFAIPLNQWTHLAFTFEELLQRLYVNGAEVSRPTNAEFLVLVYDAAPVPVTIGSDWAGNASSARFSGRIDEVALYNRALTADEVLNIYNADFVGKKFSQPYFTSPAQLPDVTLGANYTQQLTTILGMPPVSFSLLEGVLPLGMTLSSAGLVSGITIAAGIYSFTVLATDTAGMFAEQTCLLEVL
jgi:Concanavalin A-like lectin/glucanases superfamily/Divergent InlB B-repeat domain/Putative Ig domain/Immunoglobulin I-set domain